MALQFAVRFVGYTCWHYKWLPNEVVPLLLTHFDSIICQSLALSTPNPRLSIIGGWDHDVIRDTFIHSVAEMPRCLSSNAEVPIEKNVANNWS